MQVHLIAAEQLRSQRRFIAGVLRRRVISAEVSSQVEPLPGDNFAVRRQDRDLQEVSGMGVLKWQESPPIVKQRRLRIVQSDA